MKNIIQKGEFDKWALLSATPYPSMFKLYHIEKSKVNVSLQKNFYQNNKLNIVNKTYIIPPIISAKTPKINIWKNK